MAITQIDLSGADKKRVFGLLAGKAGIGKTTQITMFPKDETIAVSIEDGFLSIQGSGYNAIKIETYQDALDVCALLESWPQQYVIFDSLSELYDLINNEAKDKFTAAQNYAKSDEIKMKLMFLIRTARRIISKDIFFICHTKEEKSGMALVQELCFDGKMPSELKKQFDLVVHMDERDVGGVLKRVFITDPIVSKVAKARVSPFMGITLDPIEEANLYKLTKKMKGEAV